MLGLHRRRLSVGVVAAVVLLALVLASVVSADAARPSRHQALHVVAPARPLLTSCAGGQLIFVVRGECVAVSAYGFQSGELVAARLMSAPTRYTLLRAGRTGDVQWRYVVARSARGVDVATFVGRGAARRAATRGNVVLTVPRIGVVRYLVVSWSHSWGFAR